MDKNKNRVTMKAKNIEISESKDGNFYFINTDLCYGKSAFNLNGIGLNFTEVDENVLTLKDTPVVAYMEYGDWGEEDSFLGHGVYVDWDGEMRFMSSSIGHTVDVWVENENIKPVFGLEEENLPVLKCKSKIYASRFPEYSKVLKRMLMDGELGVSWELEAKQVEYKTEQLEAIPNPRVATEYEFLGYALIGVPPAYGDMAKVVEISEEQKTRANEVNKMLSNALKEDLKNNQNKAKDIKENENKGNERSEHMEETIKSLQEQLDVANAKLKEFEEAGKDAEISELKSQLETLKAEKAEADEKLVKASNTVESLTSEVEELKPFKEKVELIEAEKAEIEKAEKIAELKTMVTKGGYVTEAELETSEEIKSMIDNCEEEKLLVLRANRILEKLDKEDSKKETSEKKNDKQEKRNFSEESKEIGFDFAKDFLGL